MTLGERFPSLTHFLGSIKTKRWLSSGIRSILHPQAIKEVLQEMNLESLRGFDLDLPAILDLFPPEQVIENIGLEKIIEIIGLEKTIETIGWQQIIQNLDASTLSEQERELLIERLQQPNENGD